MRRRQRDSSSDSSSDSIESSTGSSGPGPDQGIYECTRWVQEDIGWPTDLPIGDPISGMAWEHNGVDSGSYSVGAEGAGRQPAEPPH